MTAKALELKPRFDSLQHPELHAVGFERSFELLFVLAGLLRRIGAQPDIFIVADRLGIQREVTHAQVARQIGEREVHRQFSGRSRERAREA